MALPLSNKLHVITMENTEKLYTLKFNRADGEYLLSALRASADRKLHNYCQQYKTLGPCIYTSVLEDEYGAINALADEVEWVLPE